MGKIQVPKKLRGEDFKTEWQELINKIGFVFNDFADGVYQTLSKGVDFENLNRQVVVITVNMDKTGKVSQSPTIKTTVNGRIRGVTVLNVVNINDINKFPTGGVTISWSTKDNLLTILNITGLSTSPETSQWQLTLELIV
jgi:hypothetical protein